MIVRLVGLSMDGLVDGSIGRSIDGCCLSICADKRQFFNQNGKRQNDRKSAQTKRQIGEMVKLETPTTKRILSFLAKNDNDEKDDETMDSSVVGNDRCRCYCSCCCYGFSLSFHG